MLSPDGEIRRDEGCIDYAGQFVMIYPCHGMKGNQEWIYGPVCIVHVTVIVFGILLRRLFTCMHPA